MRKIKKLNEIWHQVPPDYYENGIASNILQRIWHNQKITTFKHLVDGQEFKKILDVGCASGILTNKVWEIFPESKVTGVDVYKRFINYGKRKYPNIQFVAADAHKLPFKSNYFDLVICYETIEHVVNPNLVLKELRRVVKKDGLVIVAMDSGSLAFRLVWWLWEKGKGKVWRNAHLHPFHHNKLGKVIESVGFRTIKKHFSHFGMEISFVLKK